MLGILTGSLTAVGLIHTKNCFCGASGCSNQRNTRSKYQIMMKELSYEGGELHYNMTVFVSFVGIRRPVNKNKNLYLLKYFVLMGVSLDLRYKKIQE